MKPTVAHDDGSADSGFESRGHRQMARHGRSFGEALSRFPDRERDRRAEAGDDSLPRMPGGLIDTASGPPATSAHRARGCRRRRASTMTWS